MTRYSKLDLFAQLRPSLEQHIAPRKLFGVPVGKGRIINADESMVYNFSESKKVWTI